MSKRYRLLRDLLGYCKGAELSVDQIGFKPIDLPDLFEPVRWVPNKGYDYWYIIMNTAQFEVLRSKRSYDNEDDSLYKYTFPTQEEAEACAEEIRQVLERRRG